MKCNYKICITVALPSPLELLQHITRFSCLNFVCFSTLLRRPLKTPRQAATKSKSLARLVIKETQKVVQQESVFILNRFSQVFHKLVRRQIKIASTIVFYFKEIFPPYGAALPSSQSKGLRPPLLRHCPTDMIHDVIDCREMGLIYSNSKFLCYNGKIVVKNFRNRKIFADDFIIFGEIN